MTRDDLIRHAGWAGAVPDTLTDALVKHLLSNPTGKRYTVTDGPGKRALAGFLLRVGETGDGTFYIAYRHPVTRQLRQVRVAKATALNVGPAREEAKRVLAKVRQGNDPAAERAREREVAREAGQPLVTVKALIDRYDAAVQVHRKARKATVVRLKHFWEQLQDMPATEVTKQAVAAIIDAAIARGLKASTCRVEYSSFRAMMAWAADEERPDRELQANPLAGKMPEAIRGKKGKPTPRIRHLGDADADEAQRLFAALADERTTPYLRLMVKLALATGLRRGAILQLERSDYRAASKTLRLRPELMKGGKAMELPLNADAVAAVEEFLAAVPRKLDDPRFFDGYTPLTWRTTLQRQRKELLARAGVSDLTVHDLRRSYGKRLEKAGVPLVGIQRLLQHANIATTAEHYSPSGAAELAAWTEKATEKA